MLSVGQRRRPPSSKLVLVASTGGHLWELRKLVPRLGATSDSLWITFDTPDSRSLLTGKRALFIPLIAPRDLSGTVSAVLPIRRALRTERFDGVVSTGAAVAVSAMVAAQGLVPDRLYVESVSRFRGPSLTGRLIAATRLARTVTQHDTWSDSRWPYVGSVLEEYTPTTPSSPIRIRRVLVTLGTIRAYGFRRLLDRLAEIIPDDVQVTWQVGSTPGDDLPGEVLQYVSAERLAAEVERADVVVTHGGIATVLGLFERGIYPVIVPRESAYGEHVDDHQTEAAEAFGTQGLAIARRVDELTWADLQAAAGRRIRGRTSA